MANLNQATIYVNPGDISATIVLPEDKFSREAIRASMQVLGFDKCTTIFDTGEFGDTQSRFSSSVKALYLDPAIGTEPPQVMRLVEAGVDNPTINAIRGRTLGRAR